MNFMDAVKAMKQGKKVKTKHMGAYCAILPGRDIIRFFEPDGREIKDSPISWPHVEATDWEIIEDETN